jgi:hypothetical protein
MDAITTLKDINQVEQTGFLHLVLRSEGHVTDNAFMDSATTLKDLA